MGSDLESTALEEWEKNVAFFKENAGRIKQQYGEEAFVVIQNQQVVDSGSDKILLNVKYQNQPALILSYKDSTKIVELPSPEWA